MYTTKLWHRVHLRSTKIVILFFLLLCNYFNALAQKDGFNMLEHDNTKYYFGIIGGFNNAQYRVFHSDYFTNFDTVQVATPKWNPGFHVGLNANYRFTPHTGLRLTPQFVLTQKELKYDFKYQKDTSIVIESIMLHLPLSFKFSSDRINNFRFYALGGGKLDYDFNSNTRSRRNDEVIRIKPIDFGYELGFGFDFYYPNYILTPEIKVSNGFSNVQFRDEKILTSKVFERINTRMIMFSLIIGG
jgi:hypothetical protein